MPELPEVETVVRLIRPRILGRRIQGVRVRWQRTLGGISQAAFGRHARGAVLAGAERRAKYIVLPLERDGRASGAFLVHLRMSGRLQVDDATTPPGPYERLRLVLADGEVLRFLDVRKFGRFTYVPDAAAALEHLGPEPLGTVFTAGWLHAALRARRRMLKPLLLDQTFLAGLGNIYVDESLFRARLHPMRRADKVTRQRAAALHAAICRVLTEAVEREGSSFDTFYRTPEGQPGSYQDQFRVYGRQGKPCPRCGAKIRKLVVGQRGTHVCPRCQRMG